MKKSFTMNTDSDIQCPSLLVDYTKCAAGKEDVELQLSLRIAARLHRRKQQQQKQHCKVPDCISLDDQDTGDSTRATNNNVTFQLRRRLVNRNNFMSFLKGHFSESDWDVEYSLLGANSSTRSMQQESDKDAPLTSDTSHTESSRTRRDTLIKKTLRKTQSMRQLNLDTSPLSIGGSLRKAPKTLALPLRSRTFHGTKSHSLMQEPTANSKFNPSLQHSLPKRTRSRGRRSVPRVYSSESGSLRHRMGLLADATKEGGYLPQSLQMDTGLNHNRRTMMKKQTSFVTGSRIRTLRA
jgi:hypothetical protein